MTDDQATSTDTALTMDSPPPAEEERDTTSFPQPEGDTSEVTAAEGSDHESEDASLSRRDVRYREKLRATEAERDTLRQNLEAMQRREVERLAADHLTKPAALWTAGVELASLIGEDGTVDPDAVLTAVQDARQQLGLEDPQAKRRRGPVVPREGTAVQSGGKTNSWTDAFKR